MYNELDSLLKEKGFSVYEKSVRKTDAGHIFVANKSGDKYVGVATSGDAIKMPEKHNEGSGKLDSGETVTLHPLSWENYSELKKHLPLVPQVCDKTGSFGSGDRLGMATAAHLAAEEKFDIFPVIAQQSPRELEKCERDFKDVLLKAVMGVLESGYTGSFGADADHIKDEKRFVEGVEAGFTMYTLDVSDALRDISGYTTTELRASAQSLSEISKKVISEWSEKKMAVPGFKDYRFTEEELTKSAIIYEESMKEGVRFYQMARTKLSDLDLEVSIDEGTRDTTPEDHLFVASFLHASGVDFKSLAPRFPGEFQKAVDYRGDMNKLKEAFNIHAELARKMQGYRLSMHSGSDKFSVYNMFGEATEGKFHIKTSGTTWLQAVRAIAASNFDVFKKMYDICLRMLPESKKAYHVDITLSDFPTRLPENALEFFETDNVLQLFHISYGALLDEMRGEIIATLKENEETHYNYVSGHIEKHLKLVFGH